MRKAQKHERVSLPKYEPCESCSDGWVTLADKTVRRCACWRAWFEKVTQAVQGDAAQRVAENERRE